MQYVFFKQKTAYEVRISDWSSDVCSSDLDLAKAEINRVTLADIVTSERHRLLTACRDDLATETVDVDRPFEALAFRLNDRRDRCWSHTRRALRCQTHDDRGGERHYRSNVFDPRGLPGCAVLSKWDLGAAPRPP